MKIIATFAVGLALASVLSAAPAQAQNTRSFVSGHGLDTNACTLGAPCRTFQRAHDTTNGGGEIAVLDTAGYGGLFISKAISIVNPGAFEAGIAIPSGGTGITISVGTSEAVILRGLTIDGGGVGATGIALLDAKALTIENCVVRNLTSSGIALAPFAASNITVSNTLVSNNGGHGIYLQPPTNGGAFVNAVFNRVEAYHNAQKGIGIFGNQDNNIDAIVVDSVAAFNQSGFYALGDGVSTPGPTVLRVFRSTTFQNGTPPFFGQTGQGVRAEAKARIIVSQSQLEDDGWSAITGSQIYSYGDNYSFGTAPPSGLIGTN